MSRQMCNGTRPVALCTHISPALLLAWTSCFEAQRSIFCIPSVAPAFRTVANANWSHYCKNFPEILNEFLWPRLIVGLNFCWLLARRIWGKFIQTVEVNKLFSRGYVSGYRQNVSRFRILLQFCALVSCHMSPTWAKHVTTRKTYWHKTQNGQTWM